MFDSCGLTKRVANGSRRGGGEVSKPVRYLPLSLLFLLAVPSSGSLYAAVVSSYVIIVRGSRLSAWAEASNLHARTRKDSLRSVSLQLGVSPSACDFTCVVIYGKIKFCVHVYASV